MFNTKPVYEGAYLHWKLTLISRNRNRNVGYICKWRIYGLHECTDLGTNYFTNELLYKWTGVRMKCNKTYGLSEHA